MVGRRTAAALAAVLGLVGVIGWSAGHVASARTRLTLAPQGNEARYKVREQLAGVDFPNDAIGRTSGITGMLLLDDHGKLIPDSSKILVDLTTLKSDKDRRDRFIQGRTLETAQYPSAVLVPAELRNLRFPLPTSGALNFTLVGDLTIHGTTYRTTWQVKATADGNSYSGTASTGFVFDDFGLTKPRVAVVLSVDDSVHLEYDFKMVRAN